MCLKIDFDMEQKILIVDDDEFMLDLLEATLTAAGYEVLRATTATDSLQLIAQAPDAAIIDIMMPSVDGFDLLQRFRKSPGTTTLPVIVLTVLRHNEAMRKALRLGADDFLCKPFNPDELLIRLERLLPRDR